MTKSAVTAGPAGRTTGNLAESLCFRHIDVTVGLSRKIADQTFAEVSSAKVAHERSQFEGRETEIKAKDRYVVITITYQKVSLPERKLELPRRKHLRSFSMMLSAAHSCISAEMEKEIGR